MMDVSATETEPGKIALKIEAENTIQPNIDIRWSNNSVYRAGLWLGFGLATAFSVLLLIGTVTAKLLQWLFK